MMAKQSGHQVLIEAGGCGQNEVQEKVLRDHEL